MKVEKWEHESQQIKEKEKKSHWDNEKKNEAFWKVKYKFVKINERWHKGKKKIRGEIRREVKEE